MKTCGSAAASRPRCRTATRGPLSRRLRGAEPRVCSGDPGQPGPIDVAPTAGDAGEVAVPNQAGQRHGRGDFVCGAERQADILQAVLQLEPGRLVALFGDQLAVVLVDR